jgi:hypothetical protein
MKTSMFFQGKDLRAACQLQLQWLKDWGSGGLFDTRKSGSNNSIRLIRSTR